MRVLFITSQAQLMGTGGGITHTRGILSLLEMIDGAEVSLLALPLPLKSVPHAGRQIRALAKSLGSGYPSKTHYLLNARARHRIRAAFATEAIDIVIFNGADLLALIDQVPPEIHCVLISHNVETNIISGQVAAFGSPTLLRRILTRDIEKTRRMEENGARRMDSVVAISHEDARWYERLSPDMRVCVISGTFAYEPYQGARPPAARPLQVAYLAKMSWWPNRQGADWFVSSILPSLPIGTVEAHFYGPGSEAFDGQHPALRGHGFVESLHTVWRSTSFTVCPILDGSGINVKLIESLYNRVPVLATPHACRGLPPIDDPAIAIVPPDEWPAFLRSEQAIALAAATVRPETANQFSAHHGVERLKAIFTCVSQDIRSRVKNK